MVSGVDEGILSAEVRNEPILVVHPVVLDD